MKKILISICLLFSSVSLIAQQKFIETDSLEVTPSLNSIAVWNNSIYTSDSLTFEIQNKTQKISYGAFGWDNNSFDYPACIKTNGIRIFVSDFNNNRIQIFDKDLNFIFSLNGNKSESEFLNPSKIAISKLGELFILDSYTPSILKFDSGFRFLFKIENSEVKNFEFENPTDIEIFNSNKFAVLDNPNLLIFSLLGNPIKNISLKEKLNFISSDGRNLYGVRGNTIYLISENRISKLFEVKINKTERIKDLAAYLDHFYVLTNKRIKIFTKLK